MIEAPNHVTRFLNAFERLYYFPLYLSFRNILCLIDSPDKSLKKIYMLYVQVTRKKKKKKKKKRLKEKKLYRLIGCGH